MGHIFNILTVSFCLCKLVNSANILAISALASPSHFIFHDVYLRELARNGHNVTFLSHNQNNNSQTNYTQILMEGVYNEIYKDIDIADVMKHSSFELIKTLYTYYEVTCVADFKTNGLKFLKNYPKDFKFDLIIWDINSMLCVYPLIEKFGNPPVIATNAYVLQPNIFRNTYQSYIPNMALPYDDHMTLWQRLNNYFHNILAEFLHYYHNQPKMIELAKQYFGETQLTVEQFERDILLVLTNYHPIANFVEAFPPNIIPVGGLHIKPSKLPTDLQAILDKSKDGVILIGFGTNVRSQDLNLEKIQIILEIFARLKQTIIWKYDNSENHVGNVPENVHMRKWVPQIDILLHPNTVLFISHCGLLSLQEIFYSGVPVICVPFFLDQRPNAKRIEQRGIGKTILFTEILFDNFHQLINEMIVNQSYTDQAKNLSKLYHDVERKPLDKAIWWTEYVLRNGKTHHLDLATRDLSFIQLYNLDIILGPFIGLLLVLFLLKLFILSVRGIIRNTMRTTLKQKLN